MDLFGSRQPPSPQPARQQSLQSFILIRAKDLLHLAPGWYEQCMDAAPWDAESEKQEWTAFDLDNSQVRQSFQAAAETVGVVVIHSDSLAGLPPIATAPQEPAVWPQGGPELGDRWKHQPGHTNPEGKLHSRFAVRFSLREADSWRQGLDSSSDKGGAPLFTTWRKVEWKESREGGLITEERGVRIPLYVVTMAAVAMMLSVLAAIELRQASRYAAASFTGSPSCGAAESL